MKIKCLQKTELRGSYAWVCGDGCCSDRCYIDIPLDINEEMTLWSGPYGDYEVPIPTDYIDYLDTNIEIREEDIQKLITNKQIEVVEE